MIKASRKAIVHRVNTQKIIKMYESGCGYHAIAGTFHDHGIEITPEYVKAVITVESGNFATKFLPNKAVRSTIAAVQNKNEPLIETNNMVLAV